ncbi:DUF6428 family protein [Reichenbachiella agarivorans]|uniref:DUF6428 family protein n=1 Tax=Reichenbachiella agarivorans TaxID=2979464 RepID=A0ABY6CNG5_9BACT|nr:DUF6428 family protein [Reichenbachiella agarivorans]UXP30898.1 DUF6428 family protein [Reichenbachiella agarivorans]
MKLSEIKTHLAKVEQINFVLPSGEQVPSHFHVTEVGSIQKHFIDCGGTVRKESVINFQLFTAEDYDHRLSAEKLRAIIELSERKLALDDLEIEVEYQGNTIGKYGLEFQNGDFYLTATQTDCLAKDQCGIPSQKPRIRLSTLKEAESCAPGSGCC